MRLLLRSLVVLSAAALVAGCDGNNNNNNNNAAATGSLTVVHASSNAPAVNVLLDGGVAIADLDYKQLANVPSAAAASYDVRVDGLLPDTTSVNVIPGTGSDPVVAVEADSQVTVIAYGDVGGSAGKGITATVVTDLDPVVPAAETRLRVFHGATNVEDVQVWVSAPGAALDASDPAVITANFGYGTFLTVDPLQVPAGDYQIRVTPSLSDTTVVFDSGTVTLPGGANLVVAAVPNTGAQRAVGFNAPIQLIASTGTALLEFLDIRTPSNVNVVHASSDAPGVDILVDGAPSGIVNLEFLGSAGPASLDPGAVTFDVLASPAAANPNPVISVDTSLVQGESATVLAVGSLSLDPTFPIEGLIVPETTRSIVTAAQVRIIHASVLAQDVDIYVKDGGTLPLSGDIDVSVAADISAVPFKEDTGYLALEPGKAYDIAVTLAGSKTPAIGPVTLTFDAGSIQSVVAHDGQNLDPAGISVLLLDY
jgi:hypothetical protein